MTDLARRKTERAMLVLGGRRSCQGGGGRCEVSMERYLGKHSLYILHAFRMRFCSTMEQYCGCMLCVARWGYPLTRYCMFMCQFYPTLRRWNV